MRIAIAMSGGVDSSVAALLLTKDRGQKSEDRGQKTDEIIGLTMKLMSCNSRCCSLEDIYTAKRVAAKLGIPHYTIDLIDVFKHEVVDYFVNEYLCGKTPNPCVVCNQKIKFGALKEKAKTLGLDYIATGHYAEVTITADRVVLKRGKDKLKDQSYFLSMLSQEALGKSIFPLSKYTKEQVKKIGKQLGVEKKESQEICFIPDNNYVEFIESYLSSRELDSGPIIDKSGNVVGQHNGIVH
ncbi:MAG: hypothetical protein HY769_02755 [Candidatus Stahlbacteria bacterium]|nr:hypothetical protein [Candidatus Stahlbacteria bacterium]